MMMKARLPGGCFPAPTLCRGRGVASVATAATSTKSVLITGANTGIGYETALALLKQGYEVTIACKDAGRGGAAQQKLRDLVPDSKVNLALCDLADLNSVKDCAKRLLDSGIILDVVINNAGVMMTPKMKTKQGHEFQFGINHLGHFALTKALLPSLTSANKPVRIVNVASAAHQFGKIDFSDINRDKKYNPNEAYGQSKLANIMFTYELDRMLKDTPNVTTNTLHPGVVRTELGRYIVNDSNRWYMGPLVSLALRTFKTPEDGAATSIYLASSPEAASTSGKFFIDCKEAKSSPDSYDTEVARKLWQLSEELTDTK